MLSVFSTILMVFNSIELSLQGGSVSAGLQYLFPVDAPLPNQYFHHIRAGDIVSTKIQGNHYVDYGVLFKKSSDEWDTWFKSNTRLTTGPDRLYLRVVANHGKAKYKNEFAAVTRHREQKYGPVDEETMSMLFIKSQDYIFYAILSDKPKTDESLSAVHVTDEYQHNRYEKYFGALKVWNPKHSLPQWVLTEHRDWLN
ncbi:uncharacterized protein LOC117183019 [Belonocnema kinseyi]|uniref:uncharacterized protein LOC117183019 n=1 Tax=Belonocnema kinseyi TaxID=2817044 RepID=UPI00143DF686|nr:uncharacterized protein LOC117183019 [Belonocnema kinseyi]